MSTDAVLGNEPDLQFVPADIGLVPLITGIIGFCPAYCPLGISSCRVPKRKGTSAKTPA